jgi:hypothetical protein
MKMNFNDIKILGINSLVLGVSMTQIDVVLKILLLLVSIGYTIHKWYLMYGKNK